MLFAMGGEFFSTFDTQKGGSSESPFCVIRLGLALDACVAFIKRSD